MINQKKVMSPCVSVCHLGKDKVCLGCGRTRKERRDWLTYNEKKRVTIMKKLSI